MTGLTPAEESLWGLEPVEVLTRRVLSFWDEIFPADRISPLFAETQELHILISTHGALIRFFLDALVGRGYDFEQEHDSLNSYRNCSLFTIEMTYENDKWEGCGKEVGFIEHLNHRPTYEGIVSEGKRI